MSGSKSIWMWVLCCHEPKGLGDESMAGPNRVRVWVLPWLGSIVFIFGFASGPKTLVFDA